MKAIGHHCCASGYDGSEGVYFSSRELDAAYEAQGLALDHWTGCLPSLDVEIVLKEFI